MKPIFAAAALALLASPAFAETDFSYAQLLGNWTVTAVGVEDGGVQALVVDDPAYMGAQVSFRDDAITWTKGTDTRPVDPTIDDCSGVPTLAPVEESYQVTCGDIAWGPGDGALLTPVDADNIQLHWYDGGILTLTRDGATAEEAG